MITKAILGRTDGLIVHVFTDEQAALKRMPYIKRWERVDKVWKGEIRYHSKSANKYWGNRKMNDHISGTLIKHLENGELKYEYY